MSAPKQKTRKTSKLAMAARAAVPCVAVGLLFAPFNLTAAMADNTTQGRADTASSRVVADQPVNTADLYQRALDIEWAGQYDVARTLYAQAAAGNHGRAHYQLGFLLLDGLGGPRDVGQAIYHLRQAADNDLSLALVPLLYAYDDQSDPQTAPDPIAASRTLLELARRDLGMAGDTIQFWSQPLKRQIQRDLQATGFYNGPIDGLIGNGSLNALRAFARSRHPVPSTPDAGFDQMVITAQGVAINAGPPVPFDRLRDLASVRAAMPGLTVLASDPSHWRISAGEESLLDWPQRLDQNVSDQDAATPLFQLPGKPRSAMLALGNRLDAMPIEELGTCALRAHTNGDFAGRYVRRCETRIAGVQLVFVAQNGPSLDNDAVHHTDPIMPQGEHLFAIELSPPPVLRLADSQ